MAHLCRGYPEGFDCLTEIPDNEIWCRVCRRRRQQEFAAGIKQLPLRAVGIELQDFEAIGLVCRCGGDPTMNLHVMTLHHRKWEWEQIYGKPAGS